MGAVEAALLRAAGSAVSPAFRSWTGRRRDRKERTAPLAELVNSGIADDLVRRRTIRRTDELVDTVFERLRPLVSGRFAALPENEIVAAVDAVSETLDEADLSDASLFAADVDPTQLAVLIREQVPAIPEKVALSDLGERLYGAVLGECCLCLTQLILQLRPFQGRAAAEMLSRLSELATLVGQLLERVPRATLDAPMGSDHDLDFKERYLNHLIGTLDYLELFGIDVHRYRLRTPLSVAYVSLAVSGGEFSRLSRQARWQPSLLRRDPGLLEDSAVRVEQALGSANRILVRGDAGSGKTTLLQWIAVTAAREEFTGELAEWNGCVPFIVRLRAYVGRALPEPEAFLNGVAGPLAGLMPPGWVHRHLQSRAILCVDGVDEVPELQRRTVRTWLRDLLLAYPGIRIVVTSRPAAAAARWLERENFSPVGLERMGPSDIRVLIRHWHEAALAAGDLPCGPEEVPRYEQRLLAQLNGSAHLQALASSPLLCAMLCALNLDRDSRLPRNRMDIYQAAVDMLLERRDVQRGVVPDLPSLTSRDRLHLLQQIAWWMTINSKVEMTRAEAVHQLTQRLAGMRQVTDSAEVVYGHILERSGILVETIPERAHFIHRTFQEYLAAREAAEQGHSGILVRNAHLDTWRETVVLAAGHANAPVLDSLLTGMLERARNETRRGRKLRLLAAGCLEVASSIEPGLLERVRRELNTLLPPRSHAEARSLAGVGEPLLSELPTSFEKLTEAQSVAVVRAAALVGGPGSLELLAQFASDSRPKVQRELAAVWEYFDPQGYVDAVLAEAPLDDGSLTIHSPALLPVLKELKYLTSLAVTFNQRIEIAQLAGISSLEMAELGRGYSGDLGDLESTNIEFLDVSLEMEQADLSGLTKLRSITNLYLKDVARGQRLNMISSMPKLRYFGLTDSQVKDLRFLRGSPGIIDVMILESVLDLQSLGELSPLTSLWLAITRGPSGGLDELAEHLPRLQKLEIIHGDWLGDVSPLKRMRELTELRLPFWCDLSALSELSGLTRLTLGRDRSPESSHAIDLTPLAGLPLKTLDIHWSDSEVDLSPLVGTNITVRIGRNVPIRPGSHPPGLRGRRLR